MSEKLKIIDGEYDDWVSLRRIEPTATIADTVQTISCDTRDFCLGWNFEQPSPYKKATCNYERWVNEGLRQISLLKASGSMEDYLIKPDEILPWLCELCEKSGGYDLDWRYLTAKVSGCSDWGIKYIRFIRHDGCFFTCNSYFIPIEWRMVADNIYDIMDKGVK